MRFAGLLIILVVLFLSFGNITFKQETGFIKTNKISNTKPVAKINPAVEHVSIDNTTLLGSSAISINGNNEFLTTAHSYGWAGNGSKNNPFLIQNLYFSDMYNSPGQDYISIGNTNFFFTLQTLYFEFLHLSSLPLLRVGIFLQNCSNVIIQNTFFISSINNSNAHMISISNCTTMEIQHNYFNTTENTAILIVQSAKINITSNFFKNNLYAINMNTYAFNISITQNNFQNNVWTVQSNSNVNNVSYLNNTISNNYFENNNISISIFGGIFGVNFGVIQNNLFQDLSLSYKGMYLQRSLNTLIKNNYISGFEIGLELGQVLNSQQLILACTTAIPECSGSGNTTSNYYTLHESNVTIIGNEFRDQNQTSILIHNYTDGNIIYNNNFLSPTVNISQAQVQIGLEQNTTNFLSKNGIGNYWADYNGTDANNDGIGDSSYIINQNISDPDPLMNPSNFTLPILNLLNESSYLTRIQVGISGGTTVEIVPTFPVQPVQTINGTTTINSVTDATFLNNFTNFFTSSFINIFSIISFASIALISLLVVNEYRKYSKTNGLESFWKHLAKKLRKNRNRKQQPFQLSESVFEELQEIINENTTKK